MALTVIELKERMVAEQEAARDIRDKADVEGRMMTDEEEATFDVHVRTAEHLEKDAKRLEKLEALEITTDQPEDRKSKPEITTPRLIEHATPINHFRYGALKAFRGQNAELNAYRSGKWLSATMFDNAEARQWCRDHNMEIRVQTEAVNAAGGFTVPDEMERSIIDLREEYGVARKETRLVAMSSDHMLIPRRTGGITATFIGETTAIDPDDKSWDNVELTAKKLAALVRMSSELSEDSIVNMADNLAAEMAYSFAVKEDQCLIDGDGTNTYGGMTGVRTKAIDGVHVGSYVAGITPADEWSEIDLSDLVTLMGALPVYAHGGAKWFISGAGKVGVLDRIAIEAGGARPIDVAGGMAMAFQGYPIVLTAALPTVAGALNGTIGFFFGDLKKSTTFGDRRGITLKVSTERYLEYDQIGIMATERFCIVNHDMGGLLAANRGAIVCMQHIT